MKIRFPLSNDQIVPLIPSCVQKNQSRQVPGTCRREGPASGRKRPTAAAAGRAPTETETSPRPDCPWPARRTPGGSTPRPMPRPSPHPTPRAPRPTPGPHLAVVLHILLQQLQLLLLLQQGRLLLLQLRTGVAEHVDLFLGYFLLLGSGKARDEGQAGRRPAPGHGGASGCTGGRELVLGQPCSPRHRERHERAT